MHYALFTCWSLFLALLVVAVLRKMTAITSALTIKSAEPQTELAPRPSAQYSAASLPREVPGDARFLSGDVHHAVNAVHGLGTQGQAQAQELAQELAQEQALEQNQEQKQEEHNAAHAHGSGGQDQHAHHS